MNNNSNNQFTPITIKLTRSGIMKTKDDLQILKAGSEITIKSITNQEKTDTEEDWAEVTATIGSKKVDGSIPLEFLKSFAGLLVEKSNSDEIRNYPRRDNRPSLIQFPFLNRIFGSTQIELGQNIATLKKELSNLVEIEKTETTATYKFKIDGPIAFDVPKIRFDFENGILIRLRIIYQYAPIGSISFSDLKHELYSLLGSPDGYTVDREGNKHIAWKKEDLMIGTNQDPLLHWYIIEIFKRAPENNAIEKLKGFRIEQGLKPPFNIIRLLTSDVTGLNHEDPSSLEKVFAEMVIIGPMFFKQFLISSITEKKADRAMFSIDSKVYEGRVLIGIKRLLLLVDPQIESTMTLYHDGLLRNATDEERIVFYRLIDFEIKGKPVFIIESAIGNLLIFLDENERIKWIEYFDDWRKPKEPSLEELFSEDELPVADRTPKFFDQLQSPEAQNPNKKQTQTQTQHKFKNLEEKAIRISPPHSSADPASASKQNIQYQKDIAAWKALPWWKRIRTQRPQK